MEAKKFKSGWAVVSVENGISKIWHSGLKSEDAAKCYLAALTCPDDDDGPQDIEQNLRAIDDLRGRLQFIVDELEELVK